MGIKEESEYRNHIQLEPISEKREAYVQGSLYEVGDEVIIKESGEIATISVLGANYVIVETTSGKYRKWLEAVEKVEEKMKDYKSMTAKQKAAHDKPRPGAPESKHTKKFRDMFGEENLEEADAKKALKNKAEKTGISYAILKKVFDRGYAAWSSSHRPGTTPTQWGLARVNSFATGGKTRTTADADLWKKHKG